VAISVIEGVAAVAWVVGVAAVLWGLRNRRVSSAEAVMLLVLLTLVPFLGPAAAVLLVSARRKEVGGTSAPRTQ
jgi:ABC-type nickel/cobalt efflux system permease component RcnA